MKDVNKVAVGVWVPEIVLMRLENDYFALVSRGVRTSMIVMSYAKCCHFNPSKVMLIEIY